MGFGKFQVYFRWDSGEPQRLQSAVSGVLGTCEVFKGALEKFQEDTMKISKKF